MAEGKLPQEESDTHIQTTETKFPILIANSQASAVIGRLLNSRNEIGKAFETGNCTRIV